MKRLEGIRCMLRNGAMKAGLWFIAWTGVTLDVPLR